MRAGIPENTLMKIAGWKTSPNLFRRWDMQNGHDIRQAAEIMEKRLRLAWREFRLSSPKGHVGIAGGSIIVRRWSGDNSGHRRPILLLVDGSTLRH
jgi:hypothetical protein